MRPSIKKIAAKNMLFAKTGSLTYITGQRSLLIIDSAIKYGEYLTNTLSPTSLPSRERGSASLSPCGRGIEGEGVVAGLVLNKFSCLSIESASTNPHMIRTHRQNKMNHFILVQRK
jgi:hypothetical protein